MKQMHSGILVDICFLLLAEKPWAMMPHTMRTYNIKYYVRFKDDILFIVNGSPRRYF